MTISASVPRFKGLRWTGTIKGGLHSLGFAEVESVRAGKYMEIRFQASDRAQAEKQVAEMCRLLLANPVIEDFRFGLEDTAA